jgi:hypothetical protein
MRMSPKRCESLVVTAGVALLTAVGLLLIRPGRVRR